MNNKFRLIILLCLVLMAGLYVGKTDAATCNSSNLFLSRQNDVVWGDTPIGVAPSDVTATPNSTVRLSVSGEDGCAGRTISIQILSGANVVKTISGNLILGKKITNQVSQLYFDWTNDLAQGTYKFKVVSPSPAGPSANNLVIQSTSQACRLSVVNTTPPLGTTFPTPIKINITAQGTCAGWVVSLKIFETTGGGNKFITTDQHTFVASDNNQSAFSWTPDRNPGAGLQATYRAEAVLGNQTLSSNTFIVSGISGGGCNNNGTCDSGETTTSCPADCKSGQNQTFKFSILNPLRGGANTVTELVQILVKWIFNLAIPIAVAMIVYSGILFLTARGDTAQVKKARDTLKWAVIGLAIILIGSGFISLIRSILELGGANTPPTNTTSGLPGTPPGATVYGCVNNSCVVVSDSFSGPKFVASNCNGTCSSSSGGLGSTCGSGRNCSSGFVCGNNSICKYSSGNPAGGPCVTGSDCSSGLTCDQSDNGIQVIEGRQLGTCIQSQSQQKTYSCVNRQCVEDPNGTMIFSECSVSCSNQ